MTARVGLTKHFVRDVGEVLIEGHDVFLMIMVLYLSLWRFDFGICCCGCCGCCGCCCCCCCSDFEW